MQHAENHNHAWQTLRATCYARVKRILEDGIHTGGSAAHGYPHQLVKIWGLGMYRFRQIEESVLPR